MNILVDKRLQEITFREYEGKTITPWQTAMNMFKLFEEIVSNTAWKDANELKANMKKVCELLIERDRLNFVVRNCSERILKILQQKCEELKIELKASQGLSQIQSLRHLTMKKVTSSTQDDSAVENISPFGMAEESGSAALEFVQQPALARRSTMAFPQTARAGRGSMGFQS